MITEEWVILVDADDNEIGTAEKLDAHRTGALHRAVSAFVFDSAGRQLLQRRAGDKYHSAGLWSNACCSHPRPGERAEDAVARRLREEMGVTTPLTPLLCFTYRAEFGDGLVEHEVDHVFTGRFDGTPHPDPVEVSEWRWVEPAELAREVRESPASFTAWFRLLLPRLQPALSQTQLSR